MPDIPTYGSPKVQRAAMPGARFTTQASPQAFGSGIAAGVEDIGGVVGRIAVQEKLKADDIAITDADTRLTAEATRLQLEAQQKRGKDSFPIVEQSAADYDKAARDIESSLSSPEQRQAFRQRAAQRKVELGARIQTHVAGERQRYDQETTASFIDNSREAAAANFRDPKAVTDQISRAQLEYLKHADRMGMDPESRKRGIASIADDTHISVVGQFMAAKDDRGALAYFQANRVAMSAKTVARLEPALQEATLRGQSQRTADKIMAPLMDDEQATRRQAYEQATTLADPALRDAVQARLDHLWGVREDGIKAVQEKRYDGAVDALAKAKGDLTAIDPGEWSRLRGPERKSLESYAATLRQRQEPETDWDQFYQLEQLAGADATRGEFLQTNLNRFRHALSDAEFKQLSTLQRTLRSADPAERGKAARGILTKAEVVDDLLRGIDINPNPVKGKVDPRAIAFRKQLDRAVLANEAASGKEATTEDVRAIGDRLLIEQVTKAPSRWNIAKDLLPFGALVDDVQVERRARTFELPGADKLAVTAAQVPAVDRARIVEALKAKGWTGEIDPAVIVDTYNRKLLGSAHAQ